MRYARLVMFFLAAGMGVPIAYAQSPSASRPCLIKEATEVEIAVADGVSSLTAKEGDFFKIALATPLVIDGQVSIPIGATGVGQVVHAARKRGGGKSGELILAARYLQVGAIRLPLRGFRINAAGSQQRGLAFTGVSISPFIVGSDVEVRPGTSAIAKVAADTTICNL
ncbi:MAG: hypothetical protein EOP61_01695 [Sphingomonadales bacterium]|nr:MAG: hypothetical protein EOP61_01695 [Sphingomonadales bacterium]